MPLDRVSLLGQHPHADRGLDLYETDRLAVEALLRTERIPHCIWEPAAGHGAIARVLRDHGHAVIASDIENHDGLHFVADFLATTSMPAGTEAILTNPPFKIVETFIAHALELCPLVAMFARLQFMEGGTGRARRHQLRRRILDEIPPARVHVFRDRLPMMHREGWEGRRARSAVAFAWFVWDRTHSGPTIITRISARADRDRSASTSAAPEIGDIMTQPSKPTLVSETSDASETPDTSETVSASDTGPPKDIFDTLDELRLSQDFIKTAGVKKLLTKVPARKPNRQSFFRVRPEAAYREALAMIEVKDDREFYPVTRRVRDSLLGEFTMFMIYTAITRQGTLFVWPVPLPGSDGKINEWHKEQHELAETAMTKWIRIAANMEMRGYDLFEPEGKIPDPAWPELSFAQILRLAFKNAVIDDYDHPVVRRLRGL
jgi:hypothetical protein